MNDVGPLVHLFLQKAGRLGCTAFRSDLGGGGVSLPLHASGITSTSTLTFSSSGCAVTHGPDGFLEPVIIL